MLNTLPYAVSKTVYEGRKYSAKDHGNGVLAEIRICQEIEMSLHSLSYVASSSSWWSHCRYKYDILDSHEWLLFLRSVIPAFVIHPLSEDLNRRLRTINFLLRHIQIIYEYNESFASRGSINALSSLFELFIEGVLSLVCRRLSRECDRNVLVLLGQLVGEQCLNIHRFACTRRTWTKNVLLVCQKELRQILHSY